MSPFFKVRRTVSCDTDATTSPATIVCASMRKVHRACPAGAGLQHQALQWASSSPVLLRRWAWGTGWRYQAASQPSATTRVLRGATFLVDPSYAEALSACVRPQALSAWRTISAGMLVLRLTVFFDTLSRQVARSTSVKSTPYRIATAPPAQ